jgi:hypothetical protein
MIIFDGPEKAGKSTLIEEVRKSWEMSGRHRCLVRHWGPVAPDDRVYVEKLKPDVQFAAGETNLMIWDRSWPSEYVYGNLLSRDRRLASDPWLGEWLYGRAFQTLGTRVMVTAPADVLEHRRDKTDLPVDVRDEKHLYEHYAVEYGWKIVDTGTTMVHLQQTVAFVLADLWRDIQGLLINPPPAYCGPRDAKIIFVGEALSAKPGMPGAWLPFTSNLTTQLGRMMGTKAFQCGWTNARDCAPQQLRAARVVVSCGEVAQKWVSTYVNPHNHINIPHPAYLFRFKKAQPLIEEVQSILDNLCKVHLI